MRKKLNAILLSILSILLSLGAGCADSGKYAVSAKGGTLGLGGEFTTALTSNINGRLGINMLDLDIGEQEITDIEYDIELDFFSFSALADWHVFNDSFRISGGIISIDNKADLEASGPSGESQEIGDIEYDWDDIGTLYSSVEIDSLAPYVGIGWGNPLTHGKRWGFTCDFGVAFTSSPDVALAATGLIPADELEKERQNIEDELDKFRFYPVISVSFFYRF
ncbi:MAG: hypothetical protein ACYSTT_05415 [Planctomycetota bacterium]|jgi:hypothetical protein